MKTVCDWFVSRHEGDMTYTDPGATWCGEPITQDVVGRTSVRFPVPDRHLPHDPFRPLVYVAPEHQRIEAPPIGTQLVCSQCGLKEVVTDETVGAYWFGFSHLFAPPSNGYALWTFCSQRCAGRYLTGADVTSRELRGVQA